MCRRIPSVTHFQLTYHENSVHLQAEGYEIVTACWTSAADASKPAPLTAAIGNRDTYEGIPYVRTATFMR